MNSTHTQTPWMQQAIALTPLLEFAEGIWGGETGVIEKIFSLLPVRAGYGVEFGQKSIGAGTLAATLKQLDWGGLYLDRAAVVPLDTRVSATGRVITLAQETVTPGNINELFAKHGVPADLDCLVIDIDGLDYWVWDAISAEYAPSLVIIEFNAHVGFGIEASIGLETDWTYKSNKDYGASFAALCALAMRKGYRLVHVHGPWNLYFVRVDLVFPVELSVKFPLMEADLALLTETEHFYDALCGQGKRPTWFGKPAPDVSIAPWLILSPVVQTTEVDLEGLTIEVLAGNHDATWYKQRKIFEEKVSLLYCFIRDEGFTHFVDIGANVGLISLLAKKANPDLSVVAVEADPKLVAVLRRNILRYELDDVHVVNAIVGQHDKGSVTFSLNPGSTLDNRVRFEKWPQTSVPMVQMETVLERFFDVKKTFIKIDTQGFELHVLKGMESWLMARQDWMIKMEFAPNWLRSQGTDPQELLSFLQLRFEFVEFSERIPYGTPGLDELFLNPISYRQQNDFLNYVTSLNKGELGWVDLLVRPK